MIMRIMMQFCIPRYFYSNLNLLSIYDGYDLSLGTVDSTSTCSHMYNLLNN